MELMVLAMILSLVAAALGPPSNSAGEHELLGSWETGQQSNGQRGVLTLNSDAFNIEDPCISGTGTWKVIGDRIELSGSYLRNMTCESRDGSLVHIVESGPVEFQIVDRDLILTGRDGAKLKLCRSHG